MSVRNVMDFCMNVSFMIGDDELDILVKQCKKLLNSNKPELAYVLANEMLISFPDFYEARCQRALSLMALKQTRGALRDFETVSRINPNWNFFVENLRNGSSVSVTGQAPKKAGGAKRRRVPLPTERSSSWSGKTIINFNNCTIYG